MKHVLFILLVGLASSTSLAQDNYPPLQGPLMGQTPPGRVAVPFAPGVISTDGWEVQGVFAPGMKEFYYVTDRGKNTPMVVIGFRKQDQGWHKYLEFKRRGEIAFSPDGSRMHMAKGFKDRQGEGWTERQSLGPVIDRDEWGIMRLTASAKGTYVFDDFRNKNALKISTLKDGKRQDPITLGPQINNGDLTAHPYIAPDESYLIWDSIREGGFGGPDLYISFKQPDGNFGQAINMGPEINSAKGDTYAAVTPDGKYILFSRSIDRETDNTDIYWVDAGIIDTLRPTFAARQ